MTPHGGGEYIPPIYECDECPPECCENEWVCWWHNRCHAVTTIVSFQFRVTRRCSANGQCQVWDFTVSDSVSVGIPGDDPQGDCPRKGCHYATASFSKSYPELAQTKLLCGSSVQNQTCWPTVGFVVTTMATAPRIHSFRGRISCDPTSNAAQTGETTMGPGCASGAMVTGAWQISPFTTGPCQGLPPFRFEAQAGGYTSTNLRDCEDGEGLRVARGKILVEDCADCPGGYGTGVVV